MKRFKFSLQTVHDVREMRKDREAVVLGQMQDEANKAEERVRHYENLRAEALENYTRRLKSGEQLNPVELELNSRHFASLNLLQQEAERVASEKRKTCLAQMQTFAAAMKEVKVTDSLRNTKMSVHETELAREEQNMVDEMVSAKFARQIQTK